MAAQQPAANGPTVLLKYRFAPGQTLHYLVANKMTIRSQKGMASQTAKSEWTTHRHMRVVSIDANQNATVETIIDRIQAKIQFDDEKSLEYDSNVGTDAPAPLKRVSESIGKPLASSQFAPNGRLISTKPLAAADALPRPETEDADDDPNRKNFLITLPENAVRVGESWKDSFAVKVSVPPSLTRSITLGRRYTLAKLENGIATIKLQTSVLTPVNNPEILAQLIQRTPQGEIIFDVAKGIITSRTLRVNEQVPLFAGPGSLMTAQSELIETVQPSKVLTAVGTAAGPAAPKR